jgi:hypothetical protein
MQQTTTNAITARLRAGMPSRSATGNRGVGFGGNVMPAGRSGNSERHHGSWVSARGDSV